MNSNNQKDNLNNSENIPKLLTIKQFAEKHKFISENGIRWLIFKEEPAFMECIVRLSRRIYIDENKFFNYLSKKSKSQTENKI